MFPLSQHVDRAHMAQQATCSGKRSLYCMRECSQQCCRQAGTFTTFHELITSHMTSSSIPVSICVFVNSKFPQFTDDISINSTDDISINSIILLWHSHCIGQP